jgi:hypothetical protein
MTTKSNEDEYFAREEVLKKEKLALDQAREMREKERDELKQLHWMHCPKCGLDLQTVSLRGVAIDRCFHCDGTWLDAGELEKLGAHESEQRGAVVRSILNIFGDPKKAK